MTAIPARPLFPLASDADLLAWPGLTPVGRASLALAKTEEAGPRLSDAPTAEAARVWLRTVRLVHALLTHPNLEPPAGAQWNVRLDVLLANATSTGEGWMPSLDAAPHQGPRPDPVPSPALRAAREALCAHPLLQIARPHLTVLERWRVWGMDMPPRSAAPAEIRSWWEGLEAQFSDVEALRSAGRAVELECVFPSGSFSFSKPRM